ncbi:MAG: alginate export family protein [Bryobacterales bacterium]|nr:alginate export family protein [Bryobacterales bacterium]
MQTRFQRAACGVVLAALAALPPITARGQSGTGEQEPRYEFGAQLRARAETRNGGGDNPTKQDAFGITRLRFDATLRPTRQVRVFVEAQDSRVQGFAPGRNSRPLEDPVDIRQGYVALGREDGPLTLFVGRRELAFVDERLIGIRNWNNISPAWDGSELVLRRGKDSVTLLAVTQVDISDGLDPPSRTRWVYGAVGVIGSGLGGHELEPFYFTSRRPLDMASNLGGELRTAGSRLSGLFAETWDYQVILAGQRGGAGNRRQNAWMGVWALGKTLEQRRLRPRLGVEWSYASGDSDPQDERIGTFDTLFSSPHRIYGEQDIVGLRNLRALKTGIELHPSGTWQINVDFLDFRLASRYDGLYQTNFVARVHAPPGGASSTHIGSELDFVLRYAPVPKVEVRFGVSRFMAGQFVLREVPGGGSQTFLNTALLVNL